MIRQDLVDHSPVSENAIAGQRILIVDDEQPIRDLFATCLSETYNCATAPGVLEALQLLAREPFALVITDMMMPGLSGIELLREVVARYPETDVIMVSGVNRSQRVLDAVRLGAFDYLIKPCDLDELELTVGRALERRELRRATQQYKQDLEWKNKELARRQDELERLQAQIVQSEKMASLGQLAAGVAHELNNPAGFIHGNLEFLENAVRDAQRLIALYESFPLSAEAAAQARALRDEIDYEHTAQDSISIIQDCLDGAERIRDIVQNLRIFSRLDEAEFKKVDLHEGLDATIRLLSRYYSSDGVSLHRDYGDLPLVDCYAGQLNQVWMNLLVNAAQATPNGKVTITTRFVNEQAVVSISDTGRGIAKEHLSKIFDPFFTTKPVGEGTGLGLSITYGIVERHGGSIQVESQRDQGTTFTVTIPVEARGQNS